MKRTLFFLLLCSLAVFLGTAHAVTYKYTDKAGMLCFADDLQSIPEQYRSQAVLIEGQADEDKPVTTPSGTVVPAVMQPAIVTPSTEQPEPETVSQPLLPVSSDGPLSIRLLITGGLGAGLLLVVALLGRMLAGERHEQVRTYIRTGATALFLVYLAYAHGRDLLTMVRMAGSAVDEVQRKSAEKGQKAADGIKRLDALFEEMQKVEESYK
jgi:hypothetical protein